MAAKIHRFAGTLGRFALRNKRGEYWLKLAEIVLGDQLGAAVWLIRGSGCPSGRQPSTTEDVVGAHALTEPRLIQPR